MAMNMDAMLKIRADVDGQNKIVALNRSLQSVGTTAAGVTGAMRGLTGAAAGLSGALGTLAPLLSAAGLVGMVKGTLDAADNMNDLAQSTGVSVEALSRFNKAAAVSGTNLEGVSKGLVKLNKAMVDAATGGKASTATFQALGISVKNADGSLKSADQVMLEVADRFKAMPDGAAKTALALRLFGKSGAELVPLLNMGGAAIDKMSTKMTTAFAQKADEYNDKLAMLGGKVRALGMDLTIALLPALEQITDALTVAVTAFNQLPAPLKSAAVGAATLAIAWGPLMGLMKGATGLLAGVAGGLEFMRYQAALAGGVMPMLIGGIQGLGAAILALPGWGWVLAGVTALGLLGKALYDNNSAFRDWVNNVGTIIASDFQNAMKNMVELGSAAARGVASAWSWLVDTTSNAASAIGNAFSGPFGFIANAASQVFGSVQRAIAQLWNAIPEPIRKALGQSAQMALGPASYFTGVGIRAFQMGSQQTVNRAGKGDLDGGGLGSFTPDLGALESGSGSGAKEKKGIDKAKQIRDGILSSREQLAQSKAELAILRESDPIRKIELEYAEKKRQVTAAASRDLEKAQSIEEEANIQRTRAVELQKLDLEQKNALKEKYKELGEEAYEAALKAADFNTAISGMRPAFAGILDGIEAYKESVGTLREQMARLSEDMLNTLQGSLSTAISSAVSGLASGAANIKQILSDMFKSIGDAFIKMAADIIAKQLIMFALNKALGFFGGGGGGGIGSLNLSGTSALSTSTLTPGGIFATGGVMTSDGPVPLRRYASGGVAKSTQLAMFAERGPEAYVPLPDGRSIPVKLEQQKDALNRYRPMGATGTVADGGDMQTAAAGATPASSAIDVRYTVERINNVEYVTADQFRQGMQQAALQGAQRGEQQTLRRIQQSASVRRRIGV